MDLTKDEIFHLINELNLTYERVTNIYTTIKKTKYQWRWIFDRRTICWNISWSLVRQPLWIFIPTKWDFKLHWENELVWNYHVGERSEKMERVNEILHQKKLIFITQRTERRWMSWLEKWERENNKWKCLFQSEEMSQRSTEIFTDNLFVFVLF